jgi:hypothetical protein
VHEMQALCPVCHRQKHARPETPQTPGPEITTESLASRVYHKIDGRHGNISGIFSMLSSGSSIRSGCPRDTCYATSFPAAARAACR